MFTNTQKELINDLLDLFADYYKNVKWHQTGIYLNQMPYCNFRHEVLDYKRFMLNLRWHVKHNTQDAYISNKLLKAIVKMCRYNH